ncbi:MAG: PilN domain-containing protein [Bdellovibrionaceae bacterium]|nr:PilN domain-containing protein [Pseudobdellovibrionaceae bacterium]
MIRINLLNQKIRSQVNPQLTTIAVNADVVMTRDEIQKQAFSRIGVIVLFPLLFYMYDNYYYQHEVNSLFPPLEARIDELSKFNSAKEKFVNDIKQFEKEGKIIQDKINKINFLGALRGYEIEIHKFFQKTLPQKLWFDELVYTFDQKSDVGVKGEIKIRGLSYNPSDIQMVRKAIKENILFTECEIQKQSTVDFEGQRVESFELIVKMEKRL